MKTTVSSKGQKVLLAEIREKDDTEPGLIEGPRKRRNLGDIAGTWKADKAVETAIAAQDRVDEDLLE